MTIAAVVFDFYGTLTSGRSAERQLSARSAQAAALGVDVVRFDAELTATVDARFRGAGGDVRGELAWVAGRIGAHPSPEQLDAGARVRTATERSFGEPRTDAVEVLRALRERGLRIGLVSDCSAELPVFFTELPVAGYIDAPVFSFVTGARKPEPGNYLACCSALGVEPGNCLYVGDGGSDELAGARRLGMRAIHLDVPEDGDGVVYGRHVAWDGERITSLAQVLDLV